jgi:hypothetical protein
MQTSKSVYQPLKMLSRLTKQIYKSIVGSSTSGSSIVGGRAPSSIPAVVTIADFTRSSSDRREDEALETKWKSFSDADFGGRSRASLTRKKRTSTSGGDGDGDSDGGVSSDGVLFEGYLDSSVPSLRDEKMREIRSLKRSGFAGFGWNDVKVNMRLENDEEEEAEEIELEYFSHARFTMRNYDGRAYVCSIKTERDAFGNGEHDLWQAFLLAPKTSEKSTHWTELTVPLSQFVKTYKGGVVESQTIGGKDSLRRRGNMRTIGIACGGLESGKGEMDGPFKIEVKKIELLDEERAKL